MLFVTSVMSVVNTDLKKQKFYIEIREYFFAFQADLVLGSGARSDDRHGGNCVIAARLLHFVVDTEKSSVRESSCGRRRQERFGP